jgi:hypothetical protein
MTQKQLNIHIRYIFLSTFSSQHYYYVSQFSVSSSFMKKKVQAVFRGWISRVYFEFIVDHWRASIQIQRSVRGFLSRYLI